MAGVDGRDPLADLASLREELKKYEPGLEKRPFVLVANKMDLEGSEANLERLKKAEPNSTIIPVCAELSENTDKLIRCLRSCLETLPPMDAEDLNRITVSKILINVVIHFCFPSLLRRRIAFATRHQLIIVVINLLNLPEVLCG